MGKKIWGNNKNNLIINIILLLLFRVLILFLFLIGNIPCFIDIRYFIYISYPISFIKSELFYKNNNYSFLF